MLTIFLQRKFFLTGPEVYGNTNAPPAVTYSAILYSIRCLVNRDIPLNQGCLAPVTVNLPKGTILSPSEDAGVCGGNTLTSQRVTDVVLKAFKAAAASQVGYMKIILASIMRKRQTKTYPVHATLQRCSGKLPIL